MVVKVRTEGLKEGELQTYLSNGYCVSTVNVPFSGWETLVFKADYDKAVITDWSDIDGERFNAPLESPDASHAKWLGIVREWPESE